MKLVILERGTVGADTDISALLDFGETDVYDNSLPEEVADRVAGADIVVANKMPLNAKTLYTAPELKLIAEFATGYDNIDIDYCREHGIPSTDKKRVLRAADYIRSRSVPLIGTRF